MLVNCKSADSEPTVVPKNSDFASSNKFPYTASTIRTEAIKKGIYKIELGMKKGQVAKVIGLPDYQQEYFNPGRWFWNHFENHESSWYYFHYIEHPYGIGQPDRYVEVCFDKNNSVNKVSEKDFGDTSERAIK